MRLLLLIYIYIYIILLPCFFFRFWLCYIYVFKHVYICGACPVCLCVLLLPPQDKYAPLHLAAILGHKDVAELLLGRKADVNSVDEVSADGCAGGGVGCLCVFFPLRGMAVGEGCCILFLECWCVYIYSSR